MKITITIEDTHDGTATITSDFDSPQVEVWSAAQVLWMKMIQAAQSGDDVENVKLYKRESAS